MEDLLSEHTIQEPQERWSVIKGTDYKVSDHGQIMCADGSILEQKRNKVKSGKKEFSNVYLKSDGKHKQYKVHRLVAEHFIENPGNKPDVLHRDGDTTNNHYKNLRWANRSESQTFASGDGHHLFGKRPDAKARKKMSEAKKGKNHPSFKGHFVINGKKYSSALQASKRLGVAVTTVISRCKGENEFNTWKFEPKK
jgi:hypothetical protein